MDIDDFINGYLKFALWSSIDDEGNPMDDNYSPDDLAPAALAAARDDCVDFCSANAADLAAYLKGFSTVQAGGDFWLTRNGHGAGYWDHGLGALGDRLTAAAKVYGGLYLYVGDDGLLYF